MNDATGTGGRLSRRWFLAGGIAAVIGGGAGVGIGFLQPYAEPSSRTAPRALLDALVAEQQLLAWAAVATRHDPSLRSVVAQLTGNHAAHLNALRSAAQGYDVSRPEPTPIPTITQTSSARAQLRAAEHTAATVAAHRASRLTGPTATLLASISACESTHVELLA